MDFVGNDELTLNSEYRRNMEIQILNNWFETSYRTYCEMFTRRQALGIEDEIVDEFRNKTYHNINELYEEAEVVAKEIKNLKNN